MNNKLTVFRELDIQPMRDLPFLKRSWKAPLIR
jgi:hypothetical protein